MLNEEGWVYIFERWKFEFSEGIRYRNPSQKMQKIEKISRLSRLRGGVSPASDHDGEFRRQIDRPQSELVPPLGEQHFVSRREIFYPKIFWRLIATSLKIENRSTYRPRTAVSRQGSTSPSFSASRPPARSSCRCRPTPACDLELRSAMNYQLISVVWSLSTFCLIFWNCANFHQGLLL